MLSSHAVTLKRWLVFCTLALFVQTSVATAQEPATPAPSVRTPLPSQLTVPSTPAPKAVQDALIKAAIIKGDYNGAAPPLSARVTRAGFYVTLGRALCVKPATNTIFTGRSAWFGSQAAALNRYIPVAAPNQLANLDSTGITREQATVAAMQAATAFHKVKTEAIPMHFPKFADEDKIRPVDRSAIHEAVFLGLAPSPPVGPDNMFHPGLVLINQASNHIDYQILQFRGSVPCA
jgi:hypothetical protein